MEQYKEKYKRLIPNEIEYQDDLASNLPWVGQYMTNVSGKDVIMGVFAPAFVTLFMLQFLPEQVSQYSIFVVLGVAGLGSAVLIAMPDYTSLSGLFSQYRSYKTKEGIEQRRTNDEDQELATKYWETTSSTQSETSVNKVYVDEGVIEREDGAVVGAMKIHGANLDTAPKEVKDVVTANFSNFVNDILEEFPIQIYLTTRVFNTESYLKKFRDRLDDDDINDLPLIKLYIESYIERTPEFLSDYPYREYYIIVHVTEFEIRQREREQGALEFESVPVIGEIMSEIFGSSRVETVTESQIRRRQIDEVRTRLEDIRQNGIEQMGSNASADIIDDGNEIGALVKEFWEGRDMTFKMDEDFLRDSPLVTGEHDREQMNEVSGRKTSGDL